MIDKTKLSEQIYSTVEMPQLTFIQRIPFASGDRVKLVFRISEINQNIYLEARIDHLINRPEDVFNYIKQILLNVLESWKQQHGLLINYTITDKQLRDVTRL